MLSVKRHLSIILIVLFALLAIVLVLWVFEKRLRRLDANSKTSFNTLTMKDRFAIPIAFYIKIGL